MIMTGFIFGASAIIAAALITMALVFVSTEIDPRTIKATGTATQQVEPDKFTVFLSVESEQPTAEEAADGVAGLVERVKYKLEKAGADVVTAHYAVYPVYSEVYPLAAGGTCLEGSDRECLPYESGPSDGIQMCIMIYPPPPECQPRQVITGYKAIHSLSAEADLEDVDAGELIDLAVEHGATSVGGVQYSVSEERQREVNLQLIGDAVTDAQSKAKAAAPRNHIQILSVEIFEVSGFPYLYREADKGVGTEIEPGTVGVSASVNVTFEVKV